MQTQIDLLENRDKTESRLWQPGRRRVVSTVGGKGLIMVNLSVMEMPCKELYHSGRVRVRTCSIKANSQLVELPSCWLCVSYYRHRPTLELGYNLQVGSRIASVRVQCPAQDPYRMVDKLSASPGLTCLNRDDRHLTLSAKLIYMYRMPDIAAWL